MSQLVIGGVIPALVGRRRLAQQTSSRRLQHSDMRLGLFYTQPKINQRVWDLVYLLKDHFNVDFIHSNGSRSCSPIPQSSFPAFALSSFPNSRILPYRMRGIRASNKPLIKSYSCLEYQQTPCTALVHVQRNGSPQLASHRWFYLCNALQMVQSTLWFFRLRWSSRLAFPRRTAPSIQRVLRIFVSRC